MYLFSKYLLSVYFVADILLGKGKQEQRHLELSRFQLNSGSQQFIK